MTSMMDTADIFTLTDVKKGPFRTCRLCLRPKSTQQNYKLSLKNSFSFLSLALYRSCLSLAVLLWIVASMYTTA